MTHLAAASRGEVTVAVARKFALSDAAIAHSELNGPHPRGKFVLLPSS